LSSLYSTDNAIKNRWNSALRRKVERYLAEKRGVDYSAIKPVDKEGRYEYNNTDDNVDSTMFRVISVMQTPRSATKKGGSRTDGGNDDNSATMIATTNTAAATTTTSTGYNPYANLSMYPIYYPPPPMPGQMPFAGGYGSTSSSHNNNQLAMAQSATPQVNTAAAATAATRHFASPYIRPVQTPNPSTSVKSTVGRSSSRSSGRGGGGGGSGEGFSSTKKSIFDDSPNVSLGGGSLGMRLDAQSPGSSLRSLQGIMTTSPPQSHSHSLMDTFSTPFPVESFPAFSYDEADSLNKSLFSDGIMTPFPKTPGATTFRFSSSLSSRPTTMIRTAIRISIGSDATVGTNIRNKKIGHKVSISPISKNAWKGSFLSDDDELSQTLRSLKPVKDDDDDTRRSHHGTSR
jgi:hypothetical protein